MRRLVKDWVSRRTVRGVWLSVRWNTCSRRYNRTRASSGEGDDWKAISAKRRVRRATPNYATYRQNNLPTQCPRASTQSNGASQVGFWSNRIWSRDGVILLPFGGPSRRRNQNDTCL